MLAGYICPKHGEEPGRKNEVNYCVTKCENPCVAPHILASMIQDDEEGLRDVQSISVTMLTGGCKRKTLLERTLPYHTEPDRVLPTFRGRLVHAIIATDEKQFTEKYKDWLIEHHMELPVTTESGSWMLTGTLDAHDGYRKTLYDAKTLQEYAIKKMVTGGNAGEWSDHIPDYYTKQLNLYRRMGELLDQFEVERMRLQVISFRQLITTGTKPEISMQKGWKWVKDEYDIPDVPILDNDIVDHWINIEGDEWYQILFESKKAPVRDGEWAWLCKVCPFYGTKYCPNPEKESKGENV